MKKYTLPLLGCCLMMAGMSVPGYSVGPGACIEEVNKTQCNAMTKDQWNQHCQVRHKGNYDHHHWNTDIGQNCVDRYGNGGCEYFCER